MNEAFLVEQNPWWKGRENINSDKKLVELEKLQYVWKSPLLDQPLVAGNIYSVRGPRQLGKTTALKMLIKKLLLEEKVPELSIFYWSCEDILNFEQLVALVRSYLNIAASYNVQKTYIFLDEITFVKKWERGVKLLADRGYLENSVVMITGSNIVDLKRSAERFPGRRGKYGRDFLFMPLTFRQFVSLVNPGLASKFDKIQINDLCDVGKIHLLASKLKVHETEVASLFGKYLVCGGFPISINSLMSKNTIDDWIFEMYKSWIIGDVHRLGRQETVLIQILRTIMRHHGKPMSWDALAKESEIKSHKTISAYVEMLEELFIFLISYFFDIQKGTIRPAKNKKIRFIDPLLYDVVRRWVRQERNVAPLIEDVVYSNIFSSFFLDDYIKYSEKRLYYYSEKRETDIVLEANGISIGIEVKYQEKISGEDWLNVSPFERGLLLTKNFYGKRQIGRKMHVAIPVHMFLMLI